MLPFVCVVFSIMSMPAAYCPIEFSSRHRCGLQRLRNIILRLYLSVFIVDVSLKTVRFSNYLLVPMAEMQSLSFL